MSTIRRFLSEERGVTLVLVVFMMIVIFGFAAMAIDVGDLLWNRHALQNAVDAAALAGVRELPSDGTVAGEEAARIAAYNAALDYFQSNSPDPSIVPEIVVTKTFGQPIYNTVVVTATRTRPPMLRGILGSGDIDVPASAEAIVSSVLPDCFYWPWAIEEHALLYDSNGVVQSWETPGVTFTLKVAPGDDYKSDEYGRGNFGIIRLQPPDDPKANQGAAEYLNSIENKGCLKDGKVDTKGGDIPQKTIQGVLTDDDPKGYGVSAILQCLPDFTWDKKAITVTAPPCIDYWSPGGPYPLGCPNVHNGVPAPCGHCFDPGEKIVVDKDACGRLGWIPIVPDGSFASKAEVRPVTAAAFYLIGLVDDKNQPYVVGTFLHEVEAQGEPDPTAPLTGPIARILWR